MRRTSVDRIGVIVLAGIMLLLASSSSGEIPRKINYQGMLVDATGAAMSGTHAAAFRIFDSDVGGAELWRESQAIEVDSLGVFSAILGSVDSIDAGFDGSRWLEIEVDGEVLTPRREMVSVPFAFQAANAHMVAGLHADAFADSAHSHCSLDALDGDPLKALSVDDEGSVGVGTETPGAKLDVAGTTRMTGFKMPTDAAASRVLTSDASGAGTWQAPQAVPDYDWEVSGEDMYAAVPGNVGIGVTSPSYPLHVVDDSTGNFRRVICGISQSATGRGIAGVSGSVNTTDNLVPGIGVEGGCYAQAGAGVGVKGESRAPNGRGVWGWAFSPSGVNYGVYGQTDSPDGYAGYFIGPRSYFNGAIGVGVMNPHCAVEAAMSSEHSLTTVVKGTAAGLYAGGQHVYGVEGRTESATTVNPGAGVLGVASNPDGASSGVRGEVYGHTGKGVFGWATATSGTNYGVYGRTDSGSGYAGYFTGGRNYFQGNVGIGIEAPLKKLHVYENSNGSLSYPIKIENFGNLNSTATGILFKVDGGTEDRGKGAIIYERTDTWNRGAIRFLQRRDAEAYEPARRSDAVMSIANSGMVYIGTGVTQDPRYRLQVVDQNDSATVGIHNGRWERGTALSLTGNATLGALLASGSGLASTGANFGIFAHTASLGDADQAAVYAKLDKDNQTASLCYRSAAGTKYKVYGDGIASSIMQTSKGRVNLACPESPEAWIDDYGSGEITAGAGHVDLDPTYLECITVDDVNPLKIFVQLTSPIQQQYYVKKGTTGFDVIVVGSGAIEANGTFDYRVVGKWKGYETLRFERAMDPPATVEVSNADSPE